MLLKTQFNLNMKKYNDRIDLESITCDCCGKEYKFDGGFEQMDAQEFHSMCFVGGYDSIFGDMNKVELDLCQYCLRNRLGDLLRIEED
jgi:hypothetical protein